MENIEFFSIVCNIMVHFVIDLKLYFTLLCFYYDWVKQYWKTELQMENKAVPSEMRGGQRSFYLHV